MKYISIILVITINLYAKEFTYYNANDLMDSDIKILISHKLKNRYINIKILIPTNFNSNLNHLFYNNNIDISLIEVFSYKRFVKKMDIVSQYVNLNDEVIQRYHLKTEKEDDYFFLFVDYNYKIPKDMFLVISIGGALCPKIILNLRKIYSWYVENNLVSSKPIYDITDFLIKNPDLMDK